MLLEVMQKSGEDMDQTSLVFAVFATILIVAVIALPLVLTLTSATGAPNIALSICSFGGPMPSPLSLR